MILTIKILADSFLKIRSILSVQSDLHLSLLHTNHVAKKAPSFGLAAFTKTRIAESILRTSHVGDGT